MSAARQEQNIGATLKSASMNRTVVCMYTFGYGETYSNAYKCTKYNSFMNLPLSSPAT